jgi:hypothetical protein
MDWIWSTSWRAVRGERLTTCARHPSKDLAALQQVVLGFVDLCGHVSQYPPMFHAPFIEPGLS